MIRWLMTASLSTSIFCLIASTASLAAEPGGPPPPDVAKPDGAKPGAVPKPAVTLKPDPAAKSANLAKAQNAKAKDDPAKAKPDAKAKLETVTPFTKAGERAAKAENGKAKPKEGEPAPSVDELDYIEMLPVSQQVPEGAKIYGKIYKELPNDVVMLIHKEEGRITIPKAKIKSMNFSMATRLSALPEDDYAGRYKVGLWAMEKGMYPQAIALFEELSDKEGVGTDILKQLGHAYEQRGQLDKALDKYDEYLQGHPEDTEVAELFKTLKEQVNPKEDVAAQAAAPKIVDGLEADGAWTAEKWDNANPGTVQFTTDKKGNKMVFVDSAGGAKDKMAFSRTGQPLNLSESTDMVFKIFNAGDAPLNMAIAFVNAQGDFHESKQIRVPAKIWSNQSIKVDGKVFKSNRNDFKEWNLDLLGRDHITRITFLVYGQRPTKLYLDALFFK
jgi:tetratricopeptide (TPR) repeat protein